MFRHRRSSQKPGDDLYASFKQTFPEIGPRTVPSSAAISETTTCLSDALTDATVHNRHFGEADAVKDPEITPRGSTDPWRFTPSLLDTNSFAFSAFANQPPGYYTPIPGGVNTLYHNQAGDLHTPNLGFHLGTPLSMPLADHSMHAGPSFEMHTFHPQMYQPQPFSQAHQYAPQQSFAPSSFIHQDSGYEAMEGSPENDMHMNPEVHRESLVTVPSHRFESSMAAPPIPSIEKFRYHVTLNAPTAMIRHSEEIPVTYLNKGQAYSVSIVDSLPLMPSPLPVKYRTVIRISFEDEHQRQRPSACWQLWKEGRGLAEAHQRGGKLQAVEYVDPHLGGGENDGRRPSVELECASFDSFSVTWTPNPLTTVAECSVAVRFNFLSTDFSHSKGVKGIPVRLCAKTEIISSATPDSPPGPISEVCFCKVKLFRDHGAERKLSNDVAHVKKTIDKLKQQISQVESGIKDFGKRKRSNSIVGKAAGERPGKVQKHKRTWSVSSQSSTGRPALEEDLHQKLAAVQDMFTSTRPVSVLYLRGLDQDDPDLFPVSLPGEPQDLIKASTLSRRESWDTTRKSTEVAPSDTSLVSPTPSAHSIPPLPPSKEKPVLTKAATFHNAQQLSEWSVAPMHKGHDLSSTMQHLSEPSVTPMRVHQRGTGSELTNWIEALGVDSSYKAPPERIVKPVACFYVLIKVCGKTTDDDYYRAVYLFSRTVEDLVQSIAAKCDINPSRVHRTLRINPRGLKIVVDNEVVRELPEGQDMAVEFTEIDSDVDMMVKEEDQSTVGANTPKASSGRGDTRPLELKLIY
ncbi:hypothetical protein MMC15_008401 [Xylographa vitiligo]|nr:hypothetical protein [Xylographa vitiligo]